jgi:hypothetical protein
MKNISFKPSKKETVSGYITLVTVIILIPFLLLQGTLIVKSSIDMIKASKIFSTRNGILVERNNCFEEALKYIRNNPEFTGDKSFYVGIASCDVAVTNMGEDPELGSLKNIDLIVTTDEFTAKFNRNIAVNGKNISILKN